MNKQQAGMCLYRKIDLDKMGQVDLAEIGQAIGALSDDTHEGFSNRETWEAVQFARKAISHGALFDHTNPAAIEFYTITSMGRTAHIGSLWRVNWDEVAEALRGGEG